MSPWEFARHYSQKTERLVVGLLSGTSVDGVDAALVRISGTGRSTEIHLLAFHTHPYPNLLRRQVLRLSHGKGNPGEVSQLNFALGRLFAESVESLLRQTRVDSNQIDLIASHGQTISHTALPDSHGRGEEGQYSATLQIGEPAVLSHLLGIPVVSDFRSADIAAGGQGAPLVPYVDWCLFTHPTRTRVIQNIGGIANLTYLPANATKPQVIGFDTGPGNMLMDRLIFHETMGQSTFDQDGRYASQGTIQFDVLERLLKHPFLLIPPPKSAGREQFGEEYFQRLLQDTTVESSILALSPYDAVATLTAFTAHSIADAYERFLPTLPDEVIVGGGGARNPVLMQMLQERLSPIPVLTHENIGIDSDAKEAIAFALMANETMLGNPANLPSVTGAARPVLLGKLTLP
jgi:anhydro-N-acetylmuramic acid kinase